MASLPSLPEELKFINQYLQRGQETRKKEPVISYYCNYYAAKLALEKGTKDKESKLFLTKLLDILEQEKKELADNEAVTNDIAGEAYVENFALKVFTKADNEDRTGKATRNTAKTFLASSLYIELLKLFGNISPELEDRIKYAKWKAIDITKALKEGRTPVAGPPGGEPSLQQSGFEGNDQTINNNLPDNVTFSSAPISSDLASTTTPSLDGDTFPSFPSAPTQDQPPGSIIDTFSNAQDLASSFDNLDLIGKQTVPPLPPKVNDYGNFPDNPFAQQPSTLNYSPPPGANRINFYDTPPQLPPSIPHAGFTNDYVQPQQLPQQPHQQPRQQPPQQPHQQPPQQPSQQPHQQPHQQPPQQPPQQPHQQPPPPQTPLLPHSSFSPHPQAPPQNYTQPTNLVNPPHQHPSFSAPASYPQSRQKYGMYSYPQTPQNEIDPTTVATVQKYCKFASSALDYNDVKTAVGYMNKALETLKPYNQ